MDIRSTHVEAQHVRVTAASREAPYRAGTTIERRAMPEVVQGRAREDPRQILGDSDEKQRERSSSIRVTELWWRNIAIDKYVLSKGCRAVLEVMVSTIPT